MHMHHTHTHCPFSEGNEQGKLRGCFFAQETVIAASEASPGDQDEGTGTDTTPGGEMETEAVVGSVVSIPESEYTTTTAGGQQEYITIQLPSTGQYHNHRRRAAGVHHHTTPQHRSVYWSECWSSVEERLLTGHRTHVHFLKSGSFHGVEDLSQYPSVPQRSQKEFPVRCDWICWLKHLLGLVLMDM